MASNQPYQYTDTVVDSFSLWQTVFKCLDFTVFNFVGFIMCKNVFHVWINFVFVENMLC